MTFSFKLTPTVPGPTAPQLACLESNIQEVRMLLTDIQLEIDADCAWSNCTTASLFQIEPTLYHNVIKKYSALN